MAFDGGVVAKTLNAVYITYEEAQAMKPIFQYYAKQGPWKDVRSDAREILVELEVVKPMDYAPLRGKQVFLSDRAREFYMDVLATYEPATEESL